LVERYFVVRRGDSWKINLEGRYLGEYPTQGVALSAARRFAKMASEQGRAAKVLAESMSKKMRREGMYHPIGRPRAMVARAVAPGPGFDAPAE
jgi:hypothetical protein